MQDEFLAFIRDNWDEVTEVFEQYYAEKAEEEGCDMQGDERYYGEDGYDMTPEEIYEDFAHCVEHSATYYGAYGVILTYADGFGGDILDPDDEELQMMVLGILEQEV